MSLLELLQIICEDLIPYYSRQCSNKPIMRYRLADSKIKYEAKRLTDCSFHQPIDIDLIFYFGESSIYTIDLLSKSCTCRWFLAYGTCKHIFK